MIEATVLPLEVSDRVAAIADEAIHAAFAEIADQLKALGYEVTGDVMPGEAEELEHAFQGYVLAMALNNPTIARMQDMEVN
jgi:N-acetyl-anhydromuramyl-L-alanine amidase AmpD